MFSQPDAQQNTGFFSTPVRQSIWKYFCPRGEEQSVLAMVRSLVHDAKITDLNVTFFGMSIIFGPICIAPGIEGTIRNGDDVLKINESAAFLADRLKKPVPFVDTYYASSGRAPVLAFSDIGLSDDGVTRIAQLYWS